MTTIVAATEREHLLNLTVEQLKKLCSFNQIPFSGPMAKAKLVDIIMSQEFLPEYPEDVPVYNEGQTAIAEHGDADSNGDVNRAPIVTEEELKADTQGQGVYPDDQPPTSPVEDEYPSDQLTLEGLGERPTKSILRVQQLVIELPNRQFNDGDIIQVVGQIRVDELAFPRERKGAQEFRKVRRHSAKWINPQDVDLAIAQS